MSHKKTLYQIMQRTIVDILVEIHGVEAHNLIRAAGFRAGQFFAEESLDLSSKLFFLIRQLQTIFAELKIGALTIEKAGSGEAEFVLNCSEHSRYGYVVCCYGEGFLAGILEAYMKENPTLSGYTIVLNL